MREWCISLKTVKKFLKGKISRKEKESLTGLKLTGRFSSGFFYRQDSVNYCFFSILLFRLNISMAKMLSTEQLIDGIRSNNTRLLGKAISLVESKNRTPYTSGRASETTHAFYRKIYKSRNNRSSGCRKIYFYRKLRKTGY